MLLQAIRDASAGLAIAVGIIGTAHLAVGDLVGQQGLDAANDTVVVGADELDGASLHRLGALGGITHDEDGLTQTRCFLLDATAVGEHEGRALHQGDEL